MTVYKINKDGFIEEINTDGNYKPHGWYRTKEIAFRYRNRTQSWTII